MSTATAQIRSIPTRAEGGVAWKTALAISRVFGLGLFTIAMYFLWLCGRIFTAFSGKADMVWRRLMFHRWARVVTVIIGMKIEVRGQAPAPPFFLVSNHLSYIDIVLLASQLRCMFVAKREVGKWPLIGHLAAVMNTVFIDRTQRKDVVRVNRLLDDAWSRGEGIVLFAEGTSTAGVCVNPLKPSLLDLAIRRHLPVRYASLSYRTPAGEAPAHLSVCWWGGMTFPDHVFALFKMPEFYATLIFGEETVQETDRKALAEKLHALIAARFIPVVKMEHE